MINEVLDCHRTMSNIFDQQSSADKLIVELAADYALLVEASVAVMTTRRNLQVGHWDVIGHLIKSKGCNLSDCQYY